MAAAVPSWLATAESLARSVAAEARSVARGRTRGVPRPVHDDGAPPVPLDTPIAVLVWNLQFCAGRSQEFFYDGGEAVLACPEAVRETTAGIARALATIDPDIALLQEVDACSDRTQRIDQLGPLTRALGLPCWSDAPYFQVRYVPYPPAQQMGRVDMRLLTASRFGMRRAVAWPLPRLNESWLRKQFNLRRVVFESVLPLADGGELSLLNTHLSAFSRGDGTLGRQVQTLLEHLDAFSYGELRSASHTVVEPVAPKDTDVDREILRELERAEEHFTSGGGFVGAHYFIHRWKGHDIPDAPEARRAALQRLMDGNRVETYTVDGKTALRLVRMSLSQRLDGVVEADQDTIETAEVKLPPTIRKRRS